MYFYLLILHSIWRWLVLLSLIISIYLSFKGKSGKRAFNSGANHWRHWTATIAHVQMLIGMTLYVQSPIVVYKLIHNNSGLSEQYFFRYCHLGLMLLAVVLITIGSAKAKRQKVDSEKYALMLKWFSLALLIILIAIPWPFSPLSNRPYIRGF